eukprot:gene35430-53147_t
MVSQEEACAMFSRAARGEAQTRGRLRLVCGKHFSTAVGGRAVLHCATRPRRGAAPRRLHAWLQGRWTGVREQRELEEIARQGASPWFTAYRKMLWRTGRPLVRFPAIPQPQWRGDGWTHRNGALTDGLGWGIGAPQMKKWLPPRRRLMPWDVRVCLRRPASLRFGVGALATVGAPFRPGGRYRRKQLVIYDTGEEYHDSERDYPVRRRGSRSGRGPSRRASRTSAVGGWAATPQSDSTADFPTAAPPQPASQGRRWGESPLILRADSPPRLFRCSSLPPTPGPGPSNDYDQHDAPRQSDDGGRSGDSPRCTSAE